MKKNHAVPHRDLPPKVAERAAEDEQSPVRHEAPFQRLLGRVPPRHDARTLAERVASEGRRLRERLARFGHRLTA